MITQYQNLISKTKNLLLKEIIDQNWNVVTQNQNLIKKVITQNQNLIKVKKFPWSIKQKSPISIKIIAIYKKIVLIASAIKKLLETSLEWAWE